MKNAKINANGTEIRVMGDVVNEDAYISLTDIAKYKNPDNAFIVVANWMRNHSTISFLGLWEQIHNPNFKPIEFDRFKAESGDNAFTLTPQQWIKATDAIGIISKSGRYGALMHIRILLLNLLLGFHRNLSCTLSKIISV